MKVTNKIIITLKKIGKHRGRNGKYGAIHKSKPNSELTQCGMYSPKWLDPQYSNIPSRTNVWRLVTCKNCLKKKNEKV